MKGIDETEFSYDFWESMCTRPFQFHSLQKLHPGTVGAVEQLYSNISDDEKGKKTFTKSVFWASVAQIDRFFPRSERKARERERERDAEGACVFSKGEGCRSILATAVITKAE